MFEKDKLIKAGEGDLKSIEEICAGTWEPLYRFIYYKVQNREEAEDITQETYVKAISYIKKGNTKIDKFSGFLKTVSLNVIRDKWRKKQRQGSVVNFEDISPEETALEDSTEESAQRELIKSALNELKEDQRKVVELRILKGYSVAETARIMNKNESTVRVLQYRALKHLAAVLENGERLKED